MKAKEIVLLVKETVTEIDERLGRKEQSWISFVDEFEYKLNTMGITEEDEDKYWNIASNVWTTFYKRMQ